MFPEGLFLGFLLAITLIVSFVDASVSPPTDYKIFNQDGLSFSGQTTYSSLQDPIVMKGYKSWPTGFTKGPGGFRGGVYDGTYVWLIPSDADRVIRIHPDDGTMKGYNSWPP
eukprot:PhF_6_TR2777/c0_g1_i1/m.4454